MEIEHSRPGSTPPATTGAARTLRFAQVVGRFASVQAAVQAIGFASGILLVRRLEQSEYGLFTIANTMQGTLNILADIGISIGMVSIGGKVWQDGRRFGELVSTGLRLRRMLGVFSILVITPLLYFMLTKNGASLPYTLLIIGAVLAGLFAQLSLGVLEVVPRLRADVRQIQVIDFTGSIARLIALVLLAFVFLNAAAAAIVGAVTLLFQYLLMRRYAARVVDLHAPENADDRKAMLGFIRNQAPNAIFYCLQGQITILLISFLGHRAGAVAEVGALGRLAMIFTVLGSLMANIFAPAFARCQEQARLRLLYAGIVGGVILFGLAVLGGAAFLPNEFLFILGNRYSHLQYELLLMVAGATLNMVASTLWALNASRAWIIGSWLYIPLTLTTQVALIPFLDFSTVTGVLTFNLFSAVPSLLLNIGLSFHGFRFQEEARTHVAA
ncbi:MAG: lipopolysaccharide biosynthesis protein [Chthoniobacterales bacterium]